MRAVKPCTTSITERFLYFHSEFCLNQGFESLYGGVSSLILSGTSDDCDVLVLPSKKTLCNKIIKYIDALISTEINSRMFMVWI